MRKLLTLILALFSNLLIAQTFTGYYNVNVNSHEKKTITTIDYGALRLANAQIEKNRLENLRFENDKQKYIALEISDNPLKAYDYGNLLTISTLNKNSWRREDLNTIRNMTGFKHFLIEYIVPNNFLFSSLNSFHFQNLSSDGISTDIFITPPIYNRENQNLDIEQDFSKVDIGKEVEELDVDNKKIKRIYHKKELNRATVFGERGFRTTYAWEDRFEYGITDNYIYYSESLGNGFTVHVKVRYYGNRSEVDFEKLEGRRYYLKPLMEKIVSTAKYSDLKLAK